MTTCAARSIRSTPPASGYPAIHVALPYEILFQATGLFHRGGGGGQHYAGIEARQYLAAGDFHGYLTHRARARCAIVPAPSRPRAVPHSGGPRAVARCQTAAEAGERAVLGGGGHQPPDARRAVGGLVLNAGADPHAGSRAILSQSIP